VGVAEVGASARNRPARRTRSGFRISWPKSAVFVAALLPLTWIAWKFTHDKLGANPIRELEIETGLWTLRLLAITLSITPVRKAFGWNFLVKYRRMLWLFTFSYATVHLSMWAGVDK